MTIKENDIFITILRQNHILKKILIHLTLKDCYNLSRTCTACFKATNNIKKQGDAINFIDYYDNCIITSEKGVDIAKVFPMKLFKIKSYDPDYIRRIKLKVEIEPEEIELIEYTMQDIGKKLNYALFVNPALKELSLVFYPFENLLHYEFDLPPVIEPFIGYLIKEIKNNNISTLDICNFDDASDRRYKNIIYTNINTMLDGLPNLKKIKLNIKHLTISHFYKNLVDAATRIEGVTIEIDLHMLGFLDSWEFILLSQEDCILTYILKKKILLSITNKSIYSGLNLYIWFCTLDISDFAFIRHLHVCISSFLNLYKISSYLNFMTNLEWLELRFDIIIFGEVHGEDNDMLWQSHLYKSFKNLKTLNTIKVKFVFNIHDIVEEKFSDFYKSKKKIGQLWEKELFLFLSQAPETVKKLCFFDMFELTSPMTSLLNTYFPNLCFLFIRRIDNIESECLVNLKSLKFYVSSNVDKLKLPTNVEICFVCGQKSWLDLNNHDEFSTHIYDTKNRECYKYYKSLDQFTKETSFSCNLFVAKILFNNLRNYHNIIGCLEDINEMIQIKSE